MTELPGLRTALADAAARHYGRPWWRRKRSAPGVRFALAGAAVAACVIAALVIAEGVSGPREFEAQPAAAPPAAPLAGCAGGGSGAFPAAARDAGVTAGPVLFAYAQELAQQTGIVRPSADVLRDLIEREDTGPGERERAQETLSRLPEDAYGLAGVMVVLEAGRKATVALPPEEQGRAAFFYTREAKDTERPGAAGAHRLADGDAAVTFEACDDRVTHWSGGLIVTGPPRCLRVLVYVDGEEEPLVRHLPIATAGRECDTD